MEIKRMNKFAACANSSLHKQYLTLGQKKTQTDIIEREIASINPDNFCKKVNLCEDVMHIPQLRQNSCDLCHQAMIEILPKLKDPDTQLDIIESLLKGCEKTEKFVKQCKKLVLEYGVVILANDEQLLENKDLCMPLHICKSPASKGASLSII